MVFSTVRAQSHVAESTRNSLSRVSTRRCKPNPEAQQVCGERDRYAVGDRTTVGSGPFRKTVVSNQAAKNLSSQGVQVPVPVPVIISVRNSFTRCGDSLLVVGVQPTARAPSERGRWYQRTDSPLSPADGARRDSAAHWWCGADQNAQQVCRELWRLQGRASQHCLQPPSKR